MFAGALMAKILIAEDDALIAQTLQNRLTAVGYDVVGCVASGEEALIETQRQHPDLVLMDMGLSGAMDGIATAHELRHRYNIPTVYLTSKGDPETLARAKPTRPLGYLVKPYVKEDLLRTLDLAFYNHQIEVELQRSESKFQYLSEATQLLVSSLVPSVVLQRLAEFSLPRLADFCLFEAVSNDGSQLYRVAASHVNALGQEKLDFNAANIPYEVTKDYPAIKALESAKPIFEPVMKQNWPRFKDLDCTSIVCLPLITEGKCLGAYTLGFSTSLRRHTEEDLQLGVELARRATMALKHAQLYQQSLSQIRDLRASEEIIQNLNRNLETRVTERTQELVVASATIGRSLKEKDILLQEVHHRVKNNLQVISSLLRLQSRHLTDPYATEVLSQSQNRIRSMALIHQLLYQAKDLGYINFKTYLETLLAELFKSQNAEQRGLSYILASDEIQIDLDSAIPCGLITTELVSNALKHAFPNNQSGALSVSFKHTLKGGAVLTVDDDGIGMPTGRDWKNSASAGMTIVLALCKQMNGILDCPTKMSNGTQFMFSFPLDKVNLPEPRLKTR